MGGPRTTYEWPTNPWAPQGQQIGAPGINYEDNSPANRKTTRVGGRSTDTSRVTQRYPKGNLRTPNDARTPHWTHYGYPRGKGTFIPWATYGTPANISWLPHAHPTGYVRAPHVHPTVPWVVCEVYEGSHKSRVGCQGGAHGLSVSCSWSMCGTSICCRWITLGVCVGHPLGASRSPVGCI